MTAAVASAALAGECGEWPGGVVARVLDEAGRVVSGLAGASRRAADSARKVQAVPGGRTPLRIMLSTPACIMVARRTDTRISVVVGEFRPERRPTPGRRIAELHGDTLLVVVEALTVVDPSGDRASDEVIVGRACRVEPDKHDRS